MHGLTYWEYFRARDLAQVAPYVTAIELSGAMGFGVPMLAWIPIHSKLTPQAEQMLEAFGNRSVTTPEHLKALTTAINASPAVIVSLAPARRGGPVRLRRSRLPGVRGG